MAFAESSDIAGISDSAVSMPTHRLCKIACLGSRITQPVTSCHKTSVIASCARAQSTRVPHSHRYRGLQVG